MNPIPTPALDEKESPMPPAEPMTQEIINRLKEEPVARLVYDGMRWAAEHAENRRPPPWVEGGNATAQDEARHIARAILSTLTNLTPSGVERAANQMFDESQTMVCEEEDGIIRRFWNELGEQERKDWRRLVSAALALPSEPPSQDCPHCNGDGDIDDGDHPCMMCGGSGLAEPPSQGDVEGRAREAVYLAARFSRRHEAHAIARQLIARGHKVTSRWVKPNEETILPTTSSEQAPDEDRRRFAMEDVEDVKACDWCISLMEEPRGGGRGGRHIEFGLALGLGKRLTIIGPRETVFHHLDHVEHFATAEDFHAALASKEDGRS